MRATLEDRQREMQRSVRGQQVEGAVAGFWLFPLGLAYFSTN